MHRIKSLHKLLAGSALMNITIVIFATQPKNCARGLRFGWRHLMENFRRYWPFVRRIHRLPVDSPHKGQWRGALMFSLIFAWTNGRANNRDAGDLRRHRAHYYVTVMFTGTREILRVPQQHWNQPDWYGKNTNHRKYNHTQNLPNHMHIQWVILYCDLVTPYDDIELGQLWLR